VALVRISPTPVRIRWDRSAGRPADVRWPGHHLRIAALDAVRDERAAYPVGQGPRLTLVVRGDDGTRASVAFDGRRWTVEALDPAA
jgi:hypothetical protein